MKSYMDKEVYMLDHFEKGREEGERKMAKQSLEI